MTPGARYSAAIEILDTVLDGEPAGLSLTRWARNARYAGSKDRAAIRDIVFDCLRRKRSFAFRLGEMSGRALAVAHMAYRDVATDEILTGTGYDPTPLSEREIATLATDPNPPDPIRLDYPDFLDQPFKASLGADFEPVMQAMLDRAPVDLRVNRKKATREEAIRSLASGDIRAVPLEAVPTALRIVENPRRLNGSRAYRDGLVELQDASSQAVSLFADAQAGMNVLDYCAGGGGKALALYDAIGGSGSVVAHDIAMVRMNDLPARAARAGARIRIAAPYDNALEMESFDLVFIDAPCSGTGSWRRTPDAKWRLTPGDLDNLDHVQGDILRKAATYVRPGGTCVYATCSLLVRENQQQVSSFLAEAREFTLLGHKTFTPLTTGDGFFVAKMKKTGK